MTIAEKTSNTDLLPALSWRDRINTFRQNAKFKWVPFRAYYRYRSYKYMRKIDPEMGLLRFLMNREKISLDIGANLGLFTHLLSRYSKHVHAFEPNPLAFGILNSAKDANVTLYREALTDRTQQVDLVVPRGRKGWSSNGASLRSMNVDNFRLVPTPGRRLDDLSLPPIGFIKIDVEGHELSVLQGGVETLRRDRPCLFIENEQLYTGDDVNEVFRLLAGLDYDGFFLEEGVLTNISRFSAAEHQISRRGANASGKRYVKNFVFIPR